jgi:hypothetical protein
MPKQSVDSKKGGTGDEAMVSSANSAHIKTAVKPVAVALLRVMSGAFQGGRNSWVFKPR